MQTRNANSPQEQRIEFRMGINVGDIIIQDDDIFGDGVNVAARLEALAEPGGICLSAAAHEQVRDRLNIDFEDRGEQQVKNIARPVHIYAVAFGNSDRATPPAVRGRQPRAKPSIAVLPFQNLSVDEDQEYFADGIVEEIITALSRIRWLFVIARNSSFTYRNRDVDVRTIGGELGVRYALQGSVRKAMSHVRITAQLIETETRAHIWADRYDGEWEDVFSLQDRITDSIIRAIAPTLRHAEIERVQRKRPENMDAYDLYLRALARSYAMTQESTTEAMELLQRALVFEPDYAPALAAQAILIGWQTTLGFAEWTDARREEVLSMARTAVRCDPNDPDALGVAAHVVAWAAAEFNEAIELAERACKLGPNSAFVWSQVGTAYFHAGHWREAAASLERAILLDPVDPMGYVTLSLLAHTRINLGDDVGAIEAGVRSVRKNPDYAFGWRVLAAAQALAGQIAEGSRSLETAMRLHPTWSIAWARDAAPANARSFKRMYGALHQLGSPDE
jgi:adenylate cyclase